MKGVLTLVRRIRAVSLTLAVVGLLAAAVPLSVRSANACIHWECHPCVYSQSLNLCLEYIGSWPCECCACIHEPL